MRLTISLLSGIVLALAIAAATGGLLYASHDAGVPPGAPNGSRRGVALATNTPTPTNTPSPTPTLRPIYFPSGPGNSSVSADPEGTQLRISMRAENLDEQNSSNGRGIHHVDFGVYDQNGRLVDSHRENSYPYCYFQEDPDGGCATWDFADHGFRWPGGAQVRDGLYFAHGTWYNTQLTKLRAGDSAFFIDQNGTRPFVASVSIPELGPDKQGNANEYVNALEFRTDLNFNDVPITRVSMFILAPDGRVVYQHDEGNAPYCAFSDNGSECNLWDFRANGDRWPGGEPIQRTTYTFRAIAYSGNTIVAADARADPIRPTGLFPFPPPGNPPSNNPPPNNPPPNNPPSNNPPSNNPPSGNPPSGNSSPNNPPSNNPPSNNPPANVGNCPVDVCVTDIAVSDAPKHKQDVTFTATFVNNTGGPRSFNWLILLYNPNKIGPNKGFGESPHNGITIPPGISTGSVTFKAVSGPGPCVNLYARAGIYQSPTDKTLFAGSDGQPFTRYFDVC